MVFSSALLVLGSLESCTVSRMVHQDDCDSAFMKKKTTWAFAWGLVQPAQINPGCSGMGINKVAVRTNLGFALITVATVGLVIPQRIEWCWAPPHEPLRPSQR